MATGVLVEGEYLFFFLEAEDLGLLAATLGVSAGVI